MTSRSRKVVISLLCAGLIIPIYAAVAYVGNDMDWHLVEGRPKRTLHYCAGRATTVAQQGRTVDPQRIRSGLRSPWSEWLEQAVQKWNEANTGWRFVQSEFRFPPCQVIVILGDISEDVHGGGVATPQDLDGDGLIDIYRIVIDSNLEDTVSNLPAGQDQADGARDGWSTVGSEQTRDPVGVLTHELSHAFRLDHHPDSRQEDTEDEDITDPRKNGDHGTDLSAEDIQEARDSFNAVEQLEQANPGAGGSRNNLNGVEFEFATGTFRGPAILHLNRLQTSQYIPNPLAVPDGYERIMTGIYFRTSEPPKKKIRITVPYTDKQLNGGQGVYVGDLHGYVPPPLDERSLAVFRYQARPFGKEGKPPEWVPVGGVTLDAKNNKITFETNETGIYGIGGKATKEQPQITPPETPKKTGWWRRLWEIIWSLFGRR